MNGTIQSETQEPRQKIPFSLAFTLITAAVMMLGFVLTSAPTFAVASVFCGIVGIVGFFRDRMPGRRKDAPAVRIILMLLAAGLMFTMPPISISSHGQWQYPFQRAYTGIYQNVSEPGWFPDFLGDVESGYHFDYMPGIMQGTGHYSVEFITTQERAEAYASAFAEQAKYIIPLQAYRDDYPLGGDPDKPLSLYLAEDFWNGGHAEIYVLSADPDRNHPHASAVIVDTATGKVQFSQYG